jgi:hypothetical protein
MPYFEIKNHLRGRTAFTGALLAHSDSRRAGQDPDRWVEMDLYKTGAGTYVLDRIGVSRVYHVFDGPCDRGLRIKICNLKPAVPCQECRPITSDDLDAWTDPNALVDMEEDRHEVNECAEASDVIDALMTTRKKGIVGMPFLSLPARRLLEKAAEVDEGIRLATLESIRRIA